MPTFLITMSRTDRRTAAVIASTRERAVLEAKDNFRFAEEDPLADAGEIQIAHVEEVCTSCSESFTETGSGRKSLSNPDLCEFCYLEGEV